MNEKLNNTSPQAYARVSGVLYLTIIIIALICTIGVDSNLFVEGDNLQTARNIEAHATLFRLETMALVFMYACVVALSGTLYLVLRHVDEKLALLGMLFRTAEGVIGAAATLLNLLFLAVLSGAPGFSELTRMDVESLTGLFLTARSVSLDVVLMFVGVGGAIFCYLFFRSPLVPKVLSAWGVLTYLSMLILAMVSLTRPQHPVWLDTIFYGSGTLFEVSFGVWLAARGINVAGTS